MEDNWEALLRSVARRQHSLVGRWQLADLGLTSGHWWRAIRSTRWERTSRNVLRLVGAAETSQAVAMAAVLHCGRPARLHGRSTLALFGLRAFSFRRPQVAIPFELKGRVVPGPGAVHWLRDLRPCDTTVYRGVPTETPLRAMWAVAGEYAAPHRTERGKLLLRRLVDAGVRLDLLSYESLHQSVEELRDRGRNGTQIMRWCADERPVGSNPLESRNEERFEELLRKAGRRPLVRQVPVGGIHLIGRADHRDPDRALVVEVNSVVHHSLPSDRDADLGRYSALNEAGFMVGVVWDLDIWSSPWTVAPTIDAARRLADAGVASVLHSPSCPWDDATTIDDLS